MIPEFICARSFKEPPRYTLEELQAAILDGIVSVYPILRSVEIEQHVLARHLWAFSHCRGVEGAEMLSEHAVHPEHMKLCFGWRCLDCKTTFFVADHSELYRHKCWE